MSFKVHYFDGVLLFFALEILFNLALNTSQEPQIE
ncbi:MAG: hypothetical protein ACI85I_000430 [Arenicella sp.]|jgi:hypothetical protein